MLVLGFGRFIFPGYSARRESRKKPTACAMLAAHPARHRLFALQPEDCPHHGRYRTR